MPSLFRYGRHESKPWRARCKRDGVEYFLGYFATMEEALAEERAFDKHWPQKHPYPRKNAGETAKRPSHRKEGSNAGNN